MAHTLPLPYTLLSVMSRVQPPTPPPVICRLPSPHMKRNESKNPEARFQLSIGPWHAYQATHQAWSNQRVIFFNCYYYHFPITAKFCYNKNGTTWHGHCTVFFLFVVQVEGILLPGTLLRTKVWTEAGVKRRQSLSSLVRH